MGRIEQSLEHQQPQLIRLIHGGNSQDSNGRSRASRAIADWVCRVEVRPRRRGALGSVQVGRDLPRRAHDEPHLLCGEPAGLTIGVRVGHVSEVVARVGEGQPTLVCIAALPPGGAAQARHLSKRLRSGFPDIKILVGRWGWKGGAATAQELLTAGADRVGVSLRETAGHVSELVPILAATSDAASGADLVPPRAA